MGRGKFEAWMTEEELARLRGWARDGLTDAEIAAKMGISRSTLARWKLDHEPIAQALRVGKDAADRMVENALYHRAVGYTTRVKKLYKVRRVEYDEATGRKVGEYEELVEGEEDVLVPPDVTAMRFWLANRKKLDWAQNPKVEEAAEEGTTGVVELAQVAALPERPALPEDGA